MSQIVLPNRFLSQPQGAVELAPRYKDALFFCMLRELYDTDIAKNNRFTEINPTPSVRPWGRTLTFSSGRYIKTATGIGAPAAFTIFAWVRPAATGWTSYARICETEYSVGFLFGANSSSTQYEFVTAGDLGSCVGGTLVAGQRDFVAATFASNLRSLYVNGVLVDTATSGGINPGYGHLPPVIGGSAGNPNVSNWNGDIDTLGVFPRAFSSVEIKSLYDSPWSILKAPSRRLWTVSAGGTTHDLVGTNAAQANSASAAGITQAHALIGSASTQANASATDAITQAHDLAGAASAQADVAAAGTLTQAHALTGSVSVQTNAASTGSVSQGAQFLAASAIQANTASTGAITQAHALAGAAGTQPNTASAASITQAHALAGASATQANVAAQGAISQGVVHDLAASASTQANAGTAGAVTQTHVLLCPASIQDNIAAASAIVQAHILAALSATQGNSASSGAITTGDNVLVSVVERTATFQRSKSVTVRFN